jgi:S1-C subfamily serine protease
LDKLIELPVLPVQDKADAIERYLGDRELAAPEGVWTIGNQEYEVAIIPNKFAEFPGYEYVGIVTGTRRKAWKRGEAKLLLKTTGASNVFAGVYFLGNGSRHEVSFWLSEPDVLAARVPAGSNGSMEEVLLVRVYPANRAQPTARATAPGTITTTGFGFLVAPQILATSYHLVADAKTVSVEIGPRHWKGQLLLRDPPNDLALLGIEATDREPVGDGMACLLLGDSDSLQVGDPVFTIHLPPGESPSTLVTVEGTVTSLLGPQEDPRTFEARFAVPPDSTGAPLFGKDGRVLGILASAQDNEFLRLPQEARSRPVTLAVKSTYLRSLLVLVKSVRCPARAGNERTTARGDATTAPRMGAVARIEASR